MDDCQLCGKRIRGPAGYITNKIHCYCTPGGREHSECHGSEEMFVGKWCDEPTHSDSSRVAELGRRLEEKARLRAEAELNAHQAEERMTQRLLGGGKGEILERIVEFQRAWREQYARDVEDVLRGMEGEEASPETSGSKPGN